MAIHELKSNMTKGEVTPRVHARSDAELFTAAMAEVRNYAVLQHGGARKRSGTRYTGPCKYGNKDADFIPFIFSDSQAFALEFGDLYVRIWTPRGILLSGGVPIELVSPYTEAEVERIQWAQVNDVLYLAHPSHRPMAIRRVSNSVWTLAAIDVEFLDGPYLPINDLLNRVSSSASLVTDTAVTLTWQNTLNINGGQGLVQTDVGRHVRVQLNGKWSWGVIQAVTGPTTCTALIRDGNGGGGAGVSAAAYGGANTSGITNSVVDPTKPGSGNANPYESLSWRLGAFSDTTGWPGSVSLFEGRVVWGRTNSNPRGMGFTRAGLTSTFTPSDPDGTVTDSHGIWYDLITGRADEILWLQEAPRLQIGTASAIRTIGPASSDEVMTPRNVVQRIEINTGSVAVPPVQVGPSTVHAGRFALTIRDLYFDFQVNSLVAPNLTLLYEHAMKRGVRRLAYTQEPDSLLWAATKHGELVGLTFERYERVVGFHRHPMDGAIVHSIVAIPDSANGRDALMAIVKRTINGQPVRYVEVLDPFFDEDESSVVDAFFVDCGVTYTGAAVSTITGLGHLEGATVDILADGRVMPRRSVVGGSVTLPSGVTTTKCHIGLPMVARLKTLKPRAPNPDGSRYARKSRVISAIIDVLASLGMKGGVLTYLDELFERSPSDPMSQQQPLVSGDTRFVCESVWNSDGSFTIQSDQPLPSLVRALNIHLETEP